MYTVEVLLKQVAASLSVQRKELADAEADYQRVLAALRGETTGVIELMCDRQVGKRVSVLASEVAAVQLTEKQGAASGGARVPGFLAAAVNSGNS
jgi:hypothetical protein